MVWWGWDKLGAFVAEQRPDPGSVMTFKTLMVRAGFIGGAERAGVREPRQPSPSPRQALAAESEDDGN